MVDKDWTRAHTRSLMLWLQNSTSITDKRRMWVSWSRPPRRWGA